MKIHTEKVAKNIETYRKVLALDTPLSFKAAETIHFYLSQDLKAETFFQDHFILTRPGVFSPPQRPFKKVFTLKN